MKVYGLGFSETSKYYGIQDLTEAAAYLQHPVLGKRLEEISKSVLSIPGRSAREIFGSPDDLKLKSCMTFFALVPGASIIFQEVLNKYFNGERDEMTLKLLS